MPTKLKMILKLTVTIPIDKSNYPAYWPMAKIKATECAQFREDPGLYTNCTNFPKEEEVIGIFIDE